MKFQNRCNELGDTLYRLYTREEKGQPDEDSSGMGSLLLEWSKARFYGLLVRDYIPVFLKLYEALERGKNFSRSTGVEYGDLQGSIWIEKDNKYKVVAATNNSVCRDDSTILFIFKENSITTKFLCRRVWLKEVKNNYGYNDCRDIKRPALQTYRDYNFDFGYGDGRDEGHCFSYKDDHYGEKSDLVLDKPQWDEDEIIISLNELGRFSYIANKTD